MASQKCVPCAVGNAECSPDCYWKQFFPPSNRGLYDSVDKHYGWSEFAKMVEDAPAELKKDLVDSVIYEASARNSNKESGCAELATISRLKREIKEKEERLAQLSNAERADN